MILKPAMLFKIINKIKKLEPQETKEKKTHQHAD
jgi:hypothetical protein